MDRNKLLMFGAVLAMVIVGAAGFLVGVQPQLQAADTAHQQTKATQANNAVLSAGVQTLESQFSKLDALTTQLASLKRSVPATVSSSDLITEYNGIAADTGTTIVNLTFADAQAYTEPVSVAATGTAAAPKTLTSPLITASNFSAIPVTVQIKGSYAQALDFMQGLHDGKRLFLVTAVSSSVTSDADSTAATTAPNDWTISGLVYALTDVDSAKTQQSQQSTTSTAAAGSTATDDPSTDTAAGK